MGSSMCSMAPRYGLVKRQEAFFIPRPTLKGFTFVGSLKMNLQSSKAGFLCYKRVSVLLSPPPLSAPT